MRACVLRRRTLREAESRTAAARAAGRPRATAADASPEKQTRALEQSPRFARVVTLVPPPTHPDPRGHLGNSQTRGHRALDESPALPGAGSRSSMGVVTYRERFLHPRSSVSKVGRARPTSSPPIDAAESSAAYRT